MSQSYALKRYERYIDFVTKRIEITNSLKKTRNYI